MSTFTDTMPLVDARTQLREMTPDGVDCPCCGQYAKVYRRKIHATMAKALIGIYLAGGAHDYIHAPTVTKRDANAETAKLVYWGLIEAERPGWYRLTPAGLAFVQGHGTVHRYALVYDNEVLRYEGEQVTITDALGTKFDYDELMGRRAA